jgi:hypothetical protein
LRGNNTIEMNESTMIEAVQLLLDRDAPGAGTVKSVKSKSGGYSELFTVSVEKDEPPKP